MVIDFIKMSGTGNDFIVLDNRDSRYKISDTALWVKLCQRRLGVGADGVLLFGKSEKEDFSFSIINADGSDGQMCANGARCLVYYAHHLLKLKKSHHYSFETSSGSRYEAWANGRDISLRMTDIKNQKRLNFPEFKSLNSYFVNVGCPHAVFEVENVDKVDIYQEGKKIRQHTHFNQGTNVNFFQKLKGQRIFLRTYERGVEDETLSCGTGVVAAALACHEFFGWKEEIQIKTLGGVLMVTFNDDLSDVRLSGPAEVIFVGKVQIEYRH